MPFQRTPVILWGAALAAVCCLAAPSAAQLRIVTYNTATAQNPGTQTARPGHATVLQAIGAEAVGGVARPIDVLLLQEQFTMEKTTQSLVDILNSIYGAGVYARSRLNGDTSDGLQRAGRPGLIYNTQTVQLIGEMKFGNVGENDGLDGSGNPNPNETPQQPRSSMRYQLRPVGYDASADFYAYSDHYKADTGVGENNRRLAEAQAVRTSADALGPGASIIYAGDFNIQSSTATMYQQLLSAGDGQAFDPINISGTWHQDGNNNPTPMKIVHTQSPVFDALFDGQTTGGMDDRFDFQLVSGELIDNEGMSYIAGSYHAFGNNGTHICCNNPISTGTGAAPTVLQALMASSDHLPVVADYQLPAKLGVDVAKIPSFVERGSLVPVTVNITNTAPSTLPIGADELDYSLVAMGDITGNAVGIEPAGGGGAACQVMLQTGSLGLKSGMIQVTSSSPQAATPSFVLPVSFTVIDRFLAADFNRDGAVDALDLAMLEANFGLDAGASMSQGDADTDGDVDGADLLAWQQDLGMMPAGIGGEPAPEPTSAGLAFAALVIGAGAACSAASDVHD